MLPFKVSFETFVLNVWFVTVYSEYLFQAVACYQVLNVQVGDSSHQPHPSFPEQGSHSTCPNPRPLHPVWV